MFANWRLIKLELSYFTLVNQVATGINRWRPYLRKNPVVSRLNPANLIQIEMIGQPLHAFVAFHVMAELA